MRSDKANTNAKWTSTDSFRDNHDRIFGDRGVVTSEPKDRTRELFLTQVGLLRSLSGMLNFHPSVLDVPDPSLRKALVNAADRIEEIADNFEQLVATVNFQ